MNQYLNILRIFERRKTDDKVVSENFFSEISKENLSS